MAEISNGGLPKNPGTVSYRQRSEVPFNAALRQTNITSFCLKSKIETSAFLGGGNPESSSYSMSLLL